MTPKEAAALLKRHKYVRGVDSTRGLAPADAAAIKAACNLLHAHERDSAAQAARDAREAVHAARLPPALRKSPRGSQPPKE